MTGLSGNYNKARLPGRVPDIPDFLLGFVGSVHLTRLSLEERRTRGFVQGSVQEIRGIAFVFRDMWDTTVLHLQPLDPTAKPK